MAIGRSSGMDKIFQVNLKLSYRIGAIGQWGFGLYEICPIDRGFWTNNCNEDINLSNRRALLDNNSNEDIKSSNRRGLLDKIALAFILE